MIKSGFDDHDAIPLDDEDLDSTSMYRETSRADSPFSALDAIGNGRMTRDGPYPGTLGEWIHK